MNKMCGHFIVSILTIVFMNVANAANVEQKDLVNQNSEIKATLNEIKPQFDINRIKELSIVILEKNYSKTTIMLSGLTKEDKVDFLFKAVKYYDYEARYKKTATIEELNNGHDSFQDTLDGLKYIK